MLSLFVHNVGQVEVSVAVRAWVLSILFAVSVLLLYRYLLGSIPISAVAASLTAFIALSYGHLYDGLKALGLSGATLVRHRYLVPLLVAGLAVLVWRLRKVSDPVGPSRYMAAVAIVLIAQPLVRLISYEVEATGLRGSVPFQTTCQLDAAQEELPDIYLFIMDAYERSDILEEMHGYDNSPFLEALGSRGFFVAEGSMSNYRHTEVSLASVLNFDYVQSFPDSYSVQSNNRSGVLELIRRSRLRTELECIGYSTVAFETGVVWTEWRDADYFLSHQGGALNGVRFLGGLTRFEALFLRTTVVRLLTDFSDRLAAQDQALTNDPVAEHRERILFAFDELESVASLPSPKLVFVHIISPHPPMVFGREGEYVNQADFGTDPTGQRVGRSVLDAYADQVHYLNGRLLEAVDAIRAGSQVPPVIVIQGDHGWADRNEEDKLSILNAYHLPNGGDRDLYPTITPVNTFRLILDYYLGADMDLLDDRSYFSTEEHVFQFELVPNTWKPGGSSK